MNAIQPEQSGHAQIDRHICFTCSSRNRPERMMPETFKDCMHVLLGPEDSRFRIPGDQESDLDEKTHQSDQNRASEVICSATLTRTVARF